jgi:hypothetical protein
MQLWDMIHFEEVLSGGDLRSKGSREWVVAAVRNERDFDALFAYHTERPCEERRSLQTRL